VGVKRKEKRVSYDELEKKKKKRAKGIAHLEEKKKKKKLNQERVDRGRE